MKNDFSMLSQIFKIFALWIFLESWNFLCAKLEIKTKPQTQLQFQSNANCLLADSVGYVVNKFEYVRGPAQWGPSWKMSRGPGLGFYTGTPWGQTDMAEDITFVTTFVGGRKVEQDHPQSVALNEVDCWLLIIVYQVISPRQISTEYIS